MPDKIQNFKAVILAALGFALFSVNDATLKVLAQSYTIPQTLFWTSVFVCIILLGYAKIKGRKKAFHSDKAEWHLLRGLFMAFMIFCNIYALLKLQIADFYTIVFTAPLVVSVLAWLFLKDSLRKRQMFTIAAGFFVILYVCRPEGQLFNIGALVAFIGVLFFSLATLLVRSKLRTEDPLLVSLDGPGVTALIALPLMAWFGFVIPYAPIDWLLFMICGAAAAFGGVFFSMGFQYATSAAVVAPLHYTQIIWGAIFGYLIFGEVPTTEVIIGAVLLAVLGAYLIYTEALLQKRSRLENESLIQHGPV